MASVKNFPALILALILFSAAMIFVLGFQIGKKTEVVVIEQDLTPLSRFGGQFLKEIQSLEDLYVDGLLEVRDRMGNGDNPILIASACRNVVGVEQAIIVPREGAFNILDVRDSDRTDSLPSPRLKRDRSFGSGIVLDYTELENRLFGLDFHWIDKPEEGLHFAAQLTYETVLVLRVNREALIRSADDWLMTWIPEAISPVRTSGIASTVKGPSGGTLASTGNVEPGRSPDFILPVSSIFGEWKIFSVPQTESVTTYYLPVIIGAAVLAAVLILAGLFGFVQQRRALKLAGQRVSFVNRVSHELRTPMTNILLNVDLLEGALNGEPVTERRLGLVKEEAGRLSRLLENVLCFSRREKLRESPDESGQDLRIEPIELAEVIDGVLEQFGATLERKNIEVIREGDRNAGAVLADKDALMQIIGNLVSNVEKYAARGGCCALLVADIPDDGRVVLSVVDQGPGISAADASKVFRPFVRLNEATKEGVSGTGLGLAIARDLAEAMGGSLQVVSENSGGESGARFELSLPRAAGNVVSIAS